ncbi:MAG: 6-bladed beta-propeller [Chloroflexota bacterium]
MRDFILGDATGDVTDPRTSNVLMRPYTVYVDAREKLYIADPGAVRVNVIDLKTADVLNITQAGNEEFVSPIGVLADMSGRIYVSDSQLKGVFVFDEKGTYLARFEGEFKRPTCMAIDEKGSMIYVSDTLEHRIYKYTFEGKRTGSIGSPGSLPGQLNYPTHLFVDREGLLYVTDSMNFRIQIFDPGGNVVGSVGVLGDKHGNLEKPKGVAVDSEGDIYVVDSINDTVKIFDRKSALLLFFGERGNNLGEFWLPSGIFIDRADIIYVADTYNMRVQAFQFLRAQEGKNKEKGEVR